MVVSQEDIDRYLNSDEKLSIAQLNNTIFAPKRDEEIVRLVRKYSAEQEDPKTMIFCKSIEHARRITKLMGDGATLVHNGQSNSTNDIALDAFRDGKIRTIVSVQMLNEGINVPDANVIVFLRNTTSPSVFYQQLGRGVRPAPGKKSVKVLDFVGNCERIQTVLELKQEIDDFRIQTPVEKTYTHGDGEADSREKFTLNIATPEFKAKMVDIVGLMDRAASWYAASDQEYLDALVAYSQELGRAPSRREVDNNPNLPASISYQKRFKTFNNALLLAGLEPNNAPKRVGDNNDTMLDDLRNFAEELGHTPSTREVEANKKLPSVRTYVARFESFNRALALAGLNPSKNSPKKSRKTQKELFRTKEDVIVALQKLHKEKGRMLRRCDLGKSEESPTYWTVMKFFPDLSSAFDAAGIISEVVLAVE